MIKLKDKRYKNSELPIIDDIDICSLIASHEDVVYYNMDNKQINAVLHAYSDIIKTAVEMGIMVPVVNLGYFYLKTCTYRGGNSNIKLLDNAKIQASITKKMAFKVKDSIQEKIANKYKKYSDNADSEEYQNLLKEYNTFKSLEDIALEYYNGDEL